MKKSIFALMLGLAAVACQPAEYDDSALNNRIDEIAGRVDALEEDVATLQLNVDAMTTLANALKNGLYITTVTAVENGYTITFSDGSSISILNGEDGAQGPQGEKGETGATGATGAAGQTPTIEVKEVDGELYWYINGVKTAPVYEGTPVFTSQDGKLYVQYPGSEELVEIGELVGKSLFDNVVVGENSVEFVLIGGGSFEVPFAEAFALEINTTVGLENGQTEVEIPYTVKGATDATVVDVIAFGCEAVVEDGAIVVTGITEGAQLLVFADNGEGKASIKKIVFDAEKYSVEAVDEVIPAEGGQVVVKGVSNVPFEVVIPAEATWLTLVETKAADFALTFAAEANDVEEPREARVALVRAGTEVELLSFTIAQEAKVVKAFAEKVWSIAAVFGGGADRNMTMDSEYVYVAQAAGGNGAIKAISIADPTVVKDVKVATKVSVSTNGTHAISCVRVFPNTNADVNGGKDVLVASNLTTGDGTARLTIYVWANGIDADPNYFVIDSGTRRLGDKFTVRGTYQAGEFWFWDFNADCAIRVSMTDGVAGLWGTPDLAYATGRLNIPVDEGTTSIGEVVAHPGASVDGDGNPAALLATTNISNGFVNQSAGNAYALSAWSNETNLTQAWGFNFFEHNGKNCIAYAQIPAGRDNVTLNVIEDVNGAADFKGTLEAHVALFTENMLETPSYAGAAGHGVGDCATAVANGVRYIAVQGQNMGVALYKLN